MKKLWSRKITTLCHQIADFAVQLVSLDFSEIGHLHLMDEGQYEIKPFVNGDGGTHGTFIESVG